MTLPATLWFFDKGKQDDKILFIDARNIFTQIDRAHREFTEEQIQNIAVISRLHRGDREAFTALVHRYFTEGFTRLADHRPKLAEVAGRVSAFLKANKVKNPPDIAKSLAGAEGLEKSYQSYRKDGDVSDVAAANKKQRKLYGIIHPFFTALHEVMKELDKHVRQVEKDSGGSKDIKLLKAELEDLHKEAKETEYFFGHIGWLQERFPDAKYEDVTGLCKLASRKDVEDQEYSLNPGRYVGVVIEEDGKTEEEFIAEMLGMNEELSRLNAEARELEDVIGDNIRMIAGDL